MEAKYDIQLMVKVAHMYYNENLKQSDIAEQLKISRSMVSLLLNEAKEVGIVEIKVRNPLLNNEEIAQDIAGAYGIQKCIIVPATIRSRSALRKLVAERAVEVFKQEVKDNDNVGISWGRTCHQFINSYENNINAKGVSIVPLIGGSNQVARYFQINEMVRMFAEKVNGTPYFIHAPALASSAEEKMAFMNSSAIKTIREKWERMNILIFSVGILPDFEDKERETYIGEEEITRVLGENDVVGDICARYIDINGNFINDEHFYQRLIGFPFNEMQKKGRKIKTICIVSGEEKVLSIIGALRTKIIDVFISDEITARAVMNAET